MLFGQASIVGTHALWLMVVTECTKQRKSSNTADVCSPLEHQRKEGEPQHDRLVDRGSLRLEHDRTRPYISRTRAHRLLLDAQTILAMV